MNWYEKNFLEQLLPYVKEAGVSGQDKDELIQVLTGKSNNKFFSQKINDDPTYYEHEKDKLANLLIGVKY